MPFPQNNRYKASKLKEKGYHKASNTMSLEKTSSSSIDGKVVMGNIFKAESICDVKRTT